MINKFVRLLLSQLDNVFKSQTSHRVSIPGLRTCRCVGRNVDSFASTMKLHAWWRHRMEIFSALLTFCAGNPPVPGEFPTQRPVTRSFDVFFDLRLNQRLSKKSWGWYFETIQRPLWRHCNDFCADGSACLKIGLLALKPLDKQITDIQIMAYSM